MRFTTLGVRQQYVLMPSRMPTNEEDRNRAGIRVSSDNSRIIDTDQERGWTKEEKLAMERHLMSCGDFGSKKLVDRGEQRGDDLLNSQVWVLWFAPQQDIPAEHREFCEGLPWYKAWNMASAKPEEPATGNPCLHTVTDGTSVLKCSSPAIGGSDYCAEHIEANSLAVV